MKDPCKRRDGINTEVISFLEPIALREVMVWPKKIGTKISHVIFRVVVLQTPRSDREKISEAITRELYVLAKHIRIEDLITVLGVLVFEADVVAAVGEVIGEIAKEKSHS